MFRTVELIKGIHPGIFLERELEKRGLKKGTFALSLQEFPQTLSAIIKGRRSMNTALAMKIEEALDLEEGILMTLQLFYDIRKLKLKEKRPSPDITQFRRVIFWDTDIEKIDWLKQKKAVIKRVFSRGNDTEKNEIVRFYGTDEVEQVLNESE